MDLPLAKQLEQRAEVLAEPLRVARTSTDGARGVAPADGKDLAASRSFWTRWTSTLRPGESRPQSATVAVVAYHLIQPRQLFRPWATVPEWPNATSLPPGRSARKERGESARLRGGLERFAPVAERVLRIERVSGGEAVVEAHRALLDGRGDPGVARIVSLPG